MSAGPQKMQGEQLAEYARENVDKDPRAILEMVMAETQRVRAIADKEIAEQQAMADVEFSRGQGLVPKNLAGIWRLAKMYAGSQMVPTHFRDRPYDCAIAIEMAIRCKVNPMAFLQKCYVVHGRPGIETQLAVAMANTSGILKGRVTYRLEGEGDSRKCTAMATLADTGEMVTETVSVEIARKSGWWNKEGSLWPKMTDLMLRYRSAMWLLRAYMPEVMMGIYSIDELRDAGQDGDLGDEIGQTLLRGMLDAVPDDFNPQPAEPTQPETKPSKADALADRLEGKPPETTETKAAGAPKEDVPVEEKKPAKTSSKSSSKKPAAKTEPKAEEKPAWTPPVDDDEPELEAAQEAVEDDSPAEDEAWDAERQTKECQTYRDKLIAAKDVEEAQAIFHFEIEQRKEKFDPLQVDWAAKQLKKRCDALRATSAPADTGSAGKTQKTLEE